MSSPIECVICYEAIEGKNCVTTECGHQYHCTCLMKHVNMNTFDCPMCRSCMGGEDMLPEEDSDSESDSDGEWDDEAERGIFRAFMVRNDNHRWPGNEGSESAASSASEEEEYSSLRSFKWMFERLAEDPTMSRRRFDDSESNDLALMGVRNMFQRAEMDLPFDLDGNSMAITPISVRRTLARRLDEEFEAVEISDQEEAEEQDLEAEADRMNNERREEDFKNYMEEFIKNTKKSISYEDLLKSHLFNNYNMGYSFDEFFNIENKVHERMEDAIHRIDARMARYIN